MGHFLGKVWNWIREQLRGVKIQIDTNRDGKPDVEVILDEQGKVISRKEIRE